jgi:hypothetical protein
MIPTQQELVAVLELCTELGDGRTSVRTAAELDPASGLDPSGAELFGPDVVHLVYAQDSRHITNILLEVARGVAFDCQLEPTEKSVPDGGTVLAWHLLPGQRADIASLGDFMRNRPVDHHIRQPVQHGWKNAL